MPTTRRSTLEPRRGSALTPMTSSGCCHRRSNLLDRYGVHGERSSSLDPGRVVYADAWQVVVTPYE